MTIRRAAAVLASIVIALLMGLGGVPAARAQSPAVELRLVSQTPWSTPKDPSLAIAVRALNIGETPVGDLTLGVTIGSAVRFLSVYEESLTQGPTLPVFATTTSEPGVIAPGASRRFEATVDMSTIGGVSSTESLVYSVRVDLRASDAPVAVLDTPAVFLAREAEVPLLLSWSLELSAPIAFAPDGLLSETSFEHTISPRGWIGAQVAALRAISSRLRPASFELVVAPAVLEQLARMADGYTRTDGTTVAEGQGGSARAAALLASLRQVAASPAAEVVAMPFAAPNLPALLASGLGRDLSSQIAVGRATVTDLLGVDPSTALARPPDGAIDERVVDALARQGNATILADAGTVTRPVQPNDFAPPPTGALGAAEGPMNLILPDPNVQALMGSAGFFDDPVRAAQALLGEVALIWRQEPVPSSPRGIAISLPPGLPAGFWKAFAERVADAPFLRTVNAEELFRQIPPSVVASQLAAPFSGSFSSSYVDAIRRERRDVRAYSSMLVGSSPVPDRLERDLLYSESGEYVGNESVGRSWVDQANGVTSATFAKAVPDTSQVFTFTSRTGTIPIRMGDPGSTPIRVSVQLRSARFRFPQGDTQTVTLSGPDQVVTFRVEAKATGQSPIEVIVRAPSGRAIRQATLVVRSTAVNTIALIVTIAAALGLVVLWSRRFFRRPTTA